MNKLAKSQSPTSDSQQGLLWGEEKCLGDVLAYQHPLAPLILVTFMSCSQPQAGSIKS